MAADSSLSANANHSKPAKNRTITDKKLKTGETKTEPTTKGIRMTAVMTR
jgi:hypothetical protein